MTLTLPGLEPPPPPPLPRLPAQMLRWSGIGVPDDVRSAGVVREYERIQRALADRIELGGWADALAWADVVGVTTLDDDRRGIELEYDEFWS